MPVNYASMRRVSPPQIGSPPLCRYLWLAGTRFSMRAPAAPREPDHRPHRNDEVRPGLAVVIDGQIVRGGLSEAVQENSEMHFIAAVAGGAL